MALQKQVITTLDNGIDINIEAAYFKIINFDGNKNIISIEVSCYKDSEASKTNISPVFSKQFVYPHNLESQDNVMRQGYLYLKTLSEFADAIDC